MKQSEKNKDSYLISNEQSDKYHYGQFKNIYRSTEMFVDWLAEMNLFDSSKSIYDLGAGGGANLHYLSKRFGGINFVGVELNDNLVTEFNKQFASDRCYMLQGDVYDLNPEDFQNKWDGMISFQFLSCLPNYEDILDQVISHHNPNWIAASSLFFEGKVQYKVIIEDYNFPLKDSPFSQFHQNVYSLEMMKRYFFEKGYTEFYYKKYDIDIDIPNKKDGFRGTYTVKTEEGSRLQISANMLMPWYFILAKK